MKDDVKMYALYVHKMLSIFEDPFLNKKYSQYSKECITKASPDFYRRMHKDFKHREIVYSKQAPTI